RSNRGDRLLRLRKPQTPPGRPLPGVMASDATANTLPPEIPREYVDWTLNLPQGGGPAHKREVIYRIPDPFTLNRIYFVNGYLMVLSEYVTTFVSSLNSRN